jgi:hypothetical protein
MEGYPASASAYGQPPQRVPTVVCRHWAKGNCQLGYSCNFKHPQQTAPLNYQLQPTGQPGADFNKEKNPYGKWQELEHFNYAQGYPNAQRSPYGMPPMNAHYPGVYPPYGQAPYGASAGPRYPAESTLRDTDGKRVCRHWERGNCSLGDTCGFAHPEWARNTKKSNFHAENGENEVEQTKAKLDKLNEALLKFEGEKKRLEEKLVNTDHDGTGQF